jgi:tRNA modification GTPase
VPPHDTIVAISSPPGAGALGIVRLSGERAIAVAEPLFRARPGARELRAVNYGTTQGRFALDRRVWVPARAYVLRAPRSYTGEDQLELHLPGAPGLLAMALERLRRGGARAAEAGEFTRRAFANAKLDLAQAEAVAALIAAVSEDERRSAFSLLDGVLSRRLHVISARLVRTLAPIELAIDFSDQDVEIADRPASASECDESIALIDDLLRAQRVRTAGPELARVVLRGAANAGKSSLLNALAGAPAAIVSARPGTTRDVLEATADIGGGRTVLLVDTAGDDHTQDAVDVAAHARRAAELERAALVLLVADGRRLPPPPERVPRAQLCVATHADLIPPAQRAHGVWLAISSVTGEGLDGLRAAIAEALDRRGGDAQVQAHLAQRHAACLERARCALVRGRDGARAGSALELIAADLVLALDAIREITGADYADAVLETIMRDFCIGK